MNRYGSAQWHILFPIVCHCLLFTHLLRQSKEKSRLIKNCINHEPVI